MNKRRHSASKRCSVSVSAAATAAQQQQWAQTQPQAVQQQPRVSSQAGATATAEADRVEPAAVSGSAADASAYHRQQPKTQQAAPVTKETEAPKPTRRKDERRWMVQCGSFKGAEQAETVRAQLAFEGFDSRITTNNGWNRVVIGPVKGKENADGMISRLKMAGHTNCIRLASGG
jgi:cell division protein FtsN